LPDSLNVANIGLGSTVNSFAMPDFTITANAGYSLSGLTAFIGNLAYTEVGQAFADLHVATTLSVDGGPGTPFSGPLSKVSTISGPGFNSGYFTDTAPVSGGTFSSLSLTNATLTLLAFGGADGAFAGIFANPQNKLEFSLIAAAVPEPESYAMFLAGLGLIGAIARRGKQQG
jgi:hypothetical protein